MKTGRTPYNRGQSNRQRIGGRQKPQQNKSSSKVRGSPWRVLAKASGRAHGTIGGDSVNSAELCVDAAIDLFDNKQIETVVQGETKPYTDADGVQHTWYGRCMIAVVDENRWIMAIRSGISHISWGSGIRFTSSPQWTRAEPGAR